MRELIEKKPSAGSQLGKLMLVGLLAGAVGVAIGSLLFPSVEIKIVEKRVEVPVEVIKYVDRVVDKVIEKRVEVPVEVIKYVDRLVEKRVEIPVERAVSRTSVPELDPLDSGHRMLRAGMRRSQVDVLVGRPYFDDGAGNLHYYSVSSRMNLRLRFDGDLLAEIIYPK